MRNPSPQVTLDVNGTIRSAFSRGNIQLWGFTGAPDNGVLTNFFRIISPGAETGSLRIQLNTDPSGNFLTNPTPPKELVVIKDNGNVGIGDFPLASPPGYKLDVQGSVNAGGLLCINGNCIDTWSSLIAGGGGAGGTGWIESTSTNKIYTTSALRKIGIGILSGDTPGAKLEVSTANDPSDNLLILRRTGIANPTLFRLGTDGNLVINSNASDVLTLRSGRVGIATTSQGTIPLASALSVNGEIYSTGGFRFPDGTTQSTAAAGGGWIKIGTNVYLTTSTDNVGIGTSSPGYKLDVQGGDVNTSGVYRKGGVAGLDQTISFYSPCGSGKVSSIIISGGLVTGYTTSPVCGSGTVTFNYIDAQQSWVVPSDAPPTIQVDVSGASGGTDGYASGFGLGSRVQTTITVTQGETIYIYVGGAGGTSASFCNCSQPGGFNGGGASGISGGDPVTSGGGASDIRRGGSALSNRVVVAGGGGAREYAFGGDGGDPNGYSGASGSGGGGGGATQFAGGSGGLGCGNGTVGAFGVGGTGGSCAGGRAGAGGGGGYYGGGGGGGTNTVGGAGGGGGGSSYSFGGIYTRAYKNGNGQVIITW